MKYKKGDKFLIEIEEVLDAPLAKSRYFIKPFKNLAFDDKALDKLERYHEFELWDVVTTKGYITNGKCLVISVDDDDRSVLLLTDDGIVMSLLWEAVEKTGEKLDVGALLKEDK